MNLKCVHCEGEAEYLVKGTSCCKEHLPTEQKSEKLLTEEDFKNLEYEINKAIKKRCASDVKFGSKNIYQTKYQQKYAEGIKTENSALWSIIIFVFGAGIGFLFASISMRNEVYQLLFLYLFGMFLIILGGVFLIIWSYIQKTCNTIILMAEQRIQNLSIEKESE